MFKVTNLPSLSLLATLMAAAATVQLTVTARAAESFRYSLAKQQEWGNKRGFNLALEGNSPDIPRKTEALKIVLHVTDEQKLAFSLFRPAMAVAARLSGQSRHRGRKSRNCGWTENSSRAAKAALCLPKIWAQ